MPWIRRSLRGNVVWARCRADGTLAVDESGRVEVKYKRDANAKIYNASAANLLATPDLAGDVPIELGEDGGAAAAAGAVRGPAGGGAPAKPTRARAASGGPAPVAADAIAVWTDGACTGNPGPMGIGVVVLADGERREVSEYLGVGTNNIAELTAIERGLQVVESLGDAAVARDVLVHSDSAYAIGLLSQGWRAKANVELVERLRRRAAVFPRLRYVKVAGHAGVPENERCDELAREAIVRRR